MSDFPSPQAVVEAQLLAYNRKDLEAWLATYAVDARQYEHPATLLARGTRKYELGPWCVSRNPTCMPG
ncbi:hypothetical protein PBOI14_62110 [Pseudomonas sp. Boi14]|nr:hypothetical protein PBOI14_62110 [Pseudomonas sp. Boi14]